MSKTPVESDWRFKLLVIRSATCGHRYPHNYTQETQVSSELICLLFLTLVLTNRRPYTQVEVAGASATMASLCL